MGNIEHWTIYVCDCGYRSTAPGNCRSHPYPMRAMGPEMEAVEVVRATAAEGAVSLTDEERERVLWWLHKPVPPGPMKDLDERIIRKLNHPGGGSSDGAS